MRMDSLWRLRDGTETVVLNTDWTVGEPMMLADIGGKEVTV